MLHLHAVRVDDGDGDDRDESVEGVELRELELVLVDEDHAEGHLDEHRQLGDRDEPPQRTRAHLRQPVGAKRPRTRQGRCRRSRTRQSSRGNRVPPLRSDRSALRGQLRPATPAAPAPLRTQMRRCRPARVISSSVNPARRRKLRARCTGFSSRSPRNPPKLNSLSTAFWKSSASFCRCGSWAVRRRSQSLPIFTWVTSSASIQSSANSSTGSRQHCAEVAHRLEHVDRQTLECPVDAGEAQDRIRVAGGLVQQRLLGELADLGTHVLAELDADLDVARLVPALPGHVELQPERRLVACLTEIEVEARAAGALERLDLADEDAVHQARGRCRWRSRTSAPACFAARWETGCADRTRRPRWPCARTARPAPAR